MTGIAFVKPDWNDTKKYWLDLDVGFKGLLDSTLPGNTPNGVKFYLPGQYGDKPELQQNPWWWGGQFQCQQVNLYLAGLGTDLAKAVGVKQVTFAFAKDDGKLEIGTGSQAKYYTSQGRLVIALPGFAGNATAKAITPGGGRMDTADYSFAKDSDAMEADPKLVTIGKEVTTTPLYVKDYGGEAVITATLVGQDNKVLHTCTLTVPFDPSHDGIASLWTFTQAVQPAQRDRQVAAPYSQLGRDALPQHEERG